MLKKYDFKETIFSYLFMLPWIIGFLSFTLIPMITSLYFSFTDYDLFTTPNWVGLSNYIRVFTDSRALKSLSVTFNYVILTVPLVLIFSLTVALALKNNRKGIRVYRALYYLPSLFGGSVAISILWKELFSKDGIINNILVNFGFTRTSFTANPDTALNVLVLLGIWQFGSSMVIFLSALKQIPNDYYEAARIDGASMRVQFFKITLPLLTPMVFFNIIMQIVSAFQAFTPAYIISKGTGSPLDSTLFYSLYLYTKAFTEFDMGYASALAWVLFVIIGLVTGLIFVTSKKWVFYE